MGTGSIVSGLKRSALGGRIKWFEIGCTLSRLYQNTALCNFCSSSLYLCFRWIFIWYEQTFFASNPLKRISFFFLWIIHDFLRFLSMISWKNSCFYLSHFFLVLHIWPIVLNLLMIESIILKNYELKIRSKYDSLCYICYFELWRKLIQSISTLGVLGKLFFYETGLKDVVWLFGRHYKK